ASRPFAERKRTPGMGAINVSMLPGGACRAREAAADQACGSSRRIRKVRRGVPSAAKDTLRLLDRSSRHADLIAEVVESNVRQHQQANGQHRSLAPAPAGVCAADELPDRGTNAPAGDGKHNRPNQELQRRKRLGSSRPTTTQKGHGEPEVWAS